MNYKKKRYIKTKFKQFLAEKNNFQNEDEVQDEPENLEDETQDGEEDILTEIIRDLKLLERRK
jgi:hypothetical protein